MATISRGEKEEEEVGDLAEGQIVAAEFGELEGVAVMDGTAASALTTAYRESNATEDLGNAVDTKQEKNTETPRLTLLEQYRKLEV